MRALTRVTTCGLGLGLGFGLAGVATARPAEPDASPLAVEATVEVEANAELAEGVDPSVSSVVLERDELERPLANVAELLQREAGVRVRRYGGLGELATLSVRGSTPEQVPVVLDDLLLNPASGGGVDVGALPAGLLERAELYRSFTPAEVGGAGIGGALRVRTRRPESTPLRVSAAAGSYDTYSLRGGTGLELGSSAAMVAWDLFRTHGDFEFYDDNGTPFNLEDDAIERRLNNRVDRADGLARIERDVGAGWRIDLSDTFGSERRGVPGLSTLQSETTTSSVERNAAQLRAVRRPRGAAHEIAFGVAHTYRSQRQRTRQLGLGFFPIDARQRLTGWSGFGRAGGAASGRHLWSARVDLRHDEVEGAGGLLGGTADRSRRTAVELAAEDQLRGRDGRWLLTPSLRYQSQTSRLDGAETRSDHWGGKLGFAWKAHPALRLRANVGRYLRLPSLSELFGDGGALLGDPALAPERGRAVDLGLVYGPSSPGPLDELRLETSAFGTETDDRILVLRVSPQSASPLNLTSTRTRGVEIGGRARWRSYTGWLETTWLRSEQRSGPSAGAPVPTIPERTLSAGLARASERWRVEYVFDYVGEDTVDLAGFERLPSRYIHGAAVEWTPRRGPALRADLRNLADRRLVDVVGYPLPGFLAWLGLTWSSDRWDRGAP